MNIYVKWLLLVGLNSITGFFLGYRPGDANFFIGMVSGVITWYFLYLFLDIYLQKNGFINISRKLTFSAVFRIPLQLTSIPDFFAGIGAIATIEYFQLNTFNSSFIESYSTTIFTGLYLSICCALIYGIITIFDKIKNSRINA